MSRKWLVFNILNTDAESVDDIIDAIRKHITMDNGAEKCPILVKRKINRPQKIVVRKPLR